MHIELNAESLLKQLGITEVDNALAQAEKVISNTKGFDKFSKHIISLNDFLKHVSGFIALSNKKDYLKIKCDEDVNSPEIVKEFHDKVNDWAVKYKVELEKVPAKEVYYILGANH